MKDYGEIEACVDCGELVEARVGVTATRCEPCSATWEAKRNADWRAFLATPVDTGVTACPKGDQRCAGPDAPFPCSACQAEWNAAQVLAAGEAGQPSVDSARAEVRALLGGVL